MFELDIPEAANKIIVTGGLDLDLPPELVSEVSNKENRFVQFLQNIWSQGENIYSGSVNDLQKVVASEYPTSNLDYCRRFAPTSTNPLLLCSPDRPACQRVILAFDYFGNSGI